MTFLRNTLRRLPAGLGALVVVLTLAPGCWTTRRWPEPMGGLEVPPEGIAVRRGGPLEVTVLRHSDPVQIRRPGAASAYPLRFFSKQERVVSGTTILCGAGGRAEVLWTESGTTAVLHGSGAVIVGEPTRGEATMRLLGVQSARVHLLPGDRIELPGGSVLSTRGTGLTGPVAIMRVASGVLRIENQTKERLSVGFREATLDLNSGEVVDLPPLASGGVPRPLDPDLESVGTRHMPTLARGEFAQASGPAGVRLLSLDATEVRAQGVRLMLAPGDEAVFSNLTDPGNVPPVDSRASDPPATPAGDVPSP